MTKIITVVTNPELGWDCVLGVYDHNTSESSIKKFHGKDVILNFQVLSSILDKGSEVIKQVEFETVKETNFGDGMCYMLFDNLKIISDSNKRLSGGKHLNENDQKIILNLVLEFIEIWKLKGLHFGMKPKLIVLHEVIQGENVFSSNFRFETKDEAEYFGQWSHENDFEAKLESWLNYEKGIELY